MKILRYGTVRFIEVRVQHVNTDLGTVTPDHLDLNRVRTDALGAD